VTTHAPEAEHDEADERQPPRSDLKDAIGWTLLGLAVLGGSLAMDRLESQNINPYTVPGLLPGLLGLAMVLLGALLALRSWGRGAFSVPLAPASAELREERKRVAIVTALCAGYGLVLVGHGLPFWLASSVYIAVSILVMQRISRDPQERRLTARVWIKALVIALAASIVTQVVFQELFLVRLP
jgi:hypothetical protein